MRAGVAGVYRRLPASLRHRLATRWMRSEKYLVSIVVPVYQVEQYLDECLRSIAAQTYRNIEVVCVDDGSPDRSVDIARRWAAQDPRFTVVRQENAGLGAARNTGVHRARGRMLFFVDSDDAVPPDAVELLLRSLLRSGSNFAVGSPARLTSRGVRQQAWARELHAVERRAVTIDEHPDMLKNVFAWTKMFRTSFFRREVGGFPDGVYEDQLPSAVAYLRGRFDVLSDVVCHWRVRDDGSSITQQKATLRDLTARWNMIRVVEPVLAEAPEAVRRAWQAKVLGFDMRPYYEQVPHVGSEYWDVLQSNVASFAARASAIGVSDLRTFDRFLVAAVNAGHREDVEELVRRSARRRSIPGVVDGAEVRVRPVFYEGLLLGPDRARDTVDPRDVRVVSHVRRVDISDRHVVVEGSAYLSWVDLSQVCSEIRVLAIAADGREIPSTLERTDTPRDQPNVSDPWNDYSGSGFVARFDVSDLRGEPVLLRVSVRVEDVEREGALRLPDFRGRGRLPSFGPLQDYGRWMVDAAGPNQELRLRRLSARRVPVLDARVADDRLELRLGTAPGPGWTFVATASGATVPGMVEWLEGRAHVSFGLPRPSGPVPDETWTLSVRDDSTRRDLRLSWAGPSGDTEFPAPSRYLVGATRYGNVVVRTAPVVGEIEDVGAAADGVRIEGWAVTATDEPPILRLRGNGGKTEAPLYLDPGGRFSTTIASPGPSWSATLVIALGTFEFRPRAAGALLRRMPLKIGDDETLHEVTATEKSGAVKVARRVADRSARSAVR